MRLSSHIDYMHVYIVHFPNRRHCEEIKATSETVGMLGKSP